MPPVKSATMATLLAQNPRAEIALRCFGKLYVGEVEQHRVRFQPHWSCEVLAAQWSPVLTVGQVERMARCTICNGRYPDVVAEVVFPDGLAPGARAPGMPARLERPGPVAYPMRRRR